MHGNLDMGSNRTRLNSSWIGTRQKLFFIEPFFRKILSTPTTVTKLDYFQTLFFIYFSSASVRFRVCLWVVRWEGWGAKMKKRPSLAAVPEIEPGDRWFPAKMVSWAFLSSGVFRWEMGFLEWRSGDLVVVYDGSEFAGFLAAHLCCVCRSLGRWWGEGGRWFFCLWLLPLIVEEDEF